MTAHVTSDLSRIAYTEAVTCRPDAPLAEVAVTMRNSGAGSVVVVDDHGRLQGIVTDRDLVVRAVAEKMEGTAPVSDVMTTDVGFVYDTEDVAATTTRMVERECRRLPVLDGDGTVVGVVALDDLLQIFGRQIDMLVQVVGHAGAWDRVTDGGP